MKIPWVHTDLLHPVVSLQVLTAQHFEPLYAVAADPLVWAQHPNPLRWQRAVFSTYFEGALLSEAAYLIVHTDTQEIMGCSRYYDWEKEGSTLKIGYTFFGRKWWGGLYNPVVKALMLQQAFLYVDRIQFEVGTYNERSIRAMQKMGATAIGKRALAYYGEATKENWVFEITKAGFIGGPLDRAYC